MKWFGKSKTADMKENNIKQIENIENAATQVKINTAKEFDLNIEKILENWEIYHAIREIISNALDEQILTNTNDISIFKDESNWWHIRDYGRGLNYHHLTQNENEEKLESDKLIGRFGVGLKDALATLYRHKIKVKIVSKHGTITLKTASKSGFDDIVTLHAEIIPTDNLNMLGTDFCLCGCNQEDIANAKALFLKFSKCNICEKTKYGEVIEKKEDFANIYINGVKVAEETNFLFSYNITSLTSQLKKALNRERTNVGRSAYTDRIKSILKECKANIVIDALINDLQQFGSGKRHDELSWNDVAMYASREMGRINASTTFVTARDLELSPSLIDEMKTKGFTPVVVPENLIEKMEDYNNGADDGETLTTSSQYLKNEQENFTPTQIKITDLTPQEKIIYDKTKQIFQIIGGKPQIVREIQIVDKIYESELYISTVGLWIPATQIILIKRTQLESIESYAGTLLHECAHARSGADDVSRSFEQELTDMIGTLSSRLLHI
ncbi:ATP-binding protein [uncultured Robinsoniella sp.]|uniref:ATP-binding protein n=1 Tax=uncultured Robinsoniella sp. TaxID=904190 RepID=UPI00374E520E